MFIPVNKLVLFSPYGYGVVNVGYTVVRQLFCNAVSPTWEITILDYGTLTPSEIQISVNSSNNIVFSGVPTKETTVQFKIKVTDFMGRSLEKLSSIVTTTSTSQSYQTVNSGTTSNVAYTSDQGRYFFQNIGTTTISFTQDRYIRVFAMGGGGSGSTGSHYSGFYAYLNHQSPGGGSSGKIDYTKQWVKVPKNTTITVVVGAGGALATNPSSGNIGSPSTVTVGSTTIVSASGGWFGQPGGGAYTVTNYNSYSSYGWSPGQNIVNTATTPYQGGFNGLNCGPLNDSTYTMMGSMEDLYDVWEYFNTPMYPATSINLQVKSTYYTDNYSHSYSGAGFGAGGAGNLDWTGNVQPTSWAGGNGGNGIDVPISNNTYAARIDTSTNSGYGGYGNQGFVLMEWN